MLLGLPQCTRRYGTAASATSGHTGVVIISAHEAALHGYRGVALLLLWVVLPLLLFVFAACRQVLGPHIWQNGAMKTTDQTHLDITHFQCLTKEEERAIEN